MATGRSYTSAIRAFPDGVTMAIFDRSLIGPVLWFATSVVAIFGLCVGSFLNVVVWRLPRGESLSHPPSHCPKCGHRIRAWENIPVLSWLLLRAKCSGCGLPISCRYPLVEAANGLLWVAVWHRLWASGLPLTHAPAWFLLSSLLLAIALIDAELFLIPDRLVAFGLGAALLLALVFPETYSLGDGGPHVLLSLGVQAMLGALADGPRGLALARLLSGAAVGYGLLWLVRALGRRCWGRAVQRREAAVELLVRNGVLRGAGEDGRELAGILLHPEDRIRIDAEGGELRQEDGQTVELGPATVLLDREGIRHPERTATWEECAELRVRARQWSLPREVLGLGDLKLMAMLGAFLGPDAVFFVVAAGSLSGLLAGGGWMLLARRGLRPVPFGPFLAAAALAWLFAGPGLLSAYSSWLSGMLRSGA